MRDIEQLRKEYKDLINEISNLRKRLDESNKNKEFWFEKKENLKKEISYLISEIREIKQTNDKSNMDINELKQQRDKYNDYMKVLINKLQRLNKEKIEIFKKHKIKEDPYKIQKRIEAIETRLETETSFENEKKLMKKLKELKNIYEGSKMKELIEKIDKISKEVSETKTKANEFHKRFIETVKGKGGYSQFIDLSRKINELRNMQQDAFNSFVSYKKEFLNVNNRLKIRLKQASNLKYKLDKHDRKVAKAKQKKFSKSFRERTNRVIDKFRKKKKLTTEDIIILQGESK